MKNDNVSSPSRKWWGWGEGDWFMRIEVTNSRDTKMIKLPECLTMENKGHHLVPITLGDETEFSVSKLSFFSSVLQRSLENLSSN